MDGSEKNVFTSSMANMAAVGVQSKEFKSIGDFKESHGRQVSNEFEPGRRLKIPETTPRVCAFCGERARCACPVCLKALYCNRDCQVKHYPIHQASCATMAAQPSSAQITEIQSPETGSVSPSGGADAAKKARKRRSPGDGQPRDPNQPQFKCEECDKVFKQSSSLKTHMRSHAGIKPFVCSVCQKNFSASFALRRHERIHTGEKAYKCDHCGKNFSRKDALKQHERVHSKDGDEGAYSEEDEQQQQQAAGSVP
eukprot:m.449434 g.449434  ORF g.449434 m.449434 type:complete len:254 (+) comp19819_c0_seq1:134-895(+)